jgi:HTH-type transcriptional regulator / antitoxin HigA
MRPLQFFQITSPHGDGNTTILVCLNPLVICFNSSFLHGMSLPMLSMIRKAGKMTLIFNQDKYKELLVKYQPKVIRNEEENERALVIVEQLMHCVNRSLEENELYDLLITLIEKFEQEYYSPGSASTPHSMLLFLMEQNNTKESDLVYIIGSQNVVSEVVNGQREISKAQAKALGDFFQVDPGVFM